MLAIALTETTKPASPTPQATNAAFRLTKHPAQGKGALGYWLASPEQPQPDAVPLIAVHGVRRGARGQALWLGAAAAAMGRPVIAPLFNKTSFPAYQRVAFGRRADIALLMLVDQLTRAGVIAGHPFDLFGYSGGAQFAHRFALFHPQRIRHLTLASAGWYTFPDEAPYPYGLAAPRRRTRAWGPHIGDNLEQLLQKPIRVCVGEYDDQADALTRSEPALNQQQGTDRLSRAANWVVAMRRASWAHGIVPDIRLHELPDCGHDFKTCIRLGGLADIALAD